jgi:DUF4097 and DUF4098 domain-containing protein YvlB
MRHTTYIHKKTQFWSIAAVIGTAVLATACVSVSVDGSTLPTEVRDDEFTVTEPPALDVRTENGRIDVVPGTDFTIPVKPTLKGPEKLEYSVSQKGDTVIVDVRRTGPSGVFNIGNSPGADFEITAPVNTAYRLVTSNGRIEIDGFQASGSLDTSNGKIVARNIVGDLQADTSNGAIEIDGYEGSAGLETSNGSITVTDCRGEFDVETSNGRIEVETELVPDGNNRMRTSNGSFTVTVLGTPSIDLDVATSNGSIKNRYPILTTGPSRDSLRGEIGDGEAELVIRTSNGSATI